MTLQHCETNGLLSVLMFWCSMLQRFTVSEDRLRSETVDEPEFLQCWSPRHWQILLWLNITVLWYVIKKNDKNNHLMVYSMVISHHAFPTALTDDQVSKHCCYWQPGQQLAIALFLSPVYITSTCATFYWSERCVYICACALSSLSVFLYHFVCVCDHIFQYVFVYLYPHFFVCVHHVHTPPCTLTVKHHC